MPYPKGSKNKVAKVSVANTDYEALIIKKASAQENVTAEIASIEEKLVSLKASLKAKKADLKVVEKQVAKLEKQKAAFNAAQVEEAKKAELESVLKQLMSNGMSSAQILEKLK